MPVNLDALSESEIIPALDRVVHEFVGGRLKKAEAYSEPNWTGQFPKCIGAVHELLTRWDGVVSRYDEISGEQAHLYLPPKQLDDEEYLLVEENQGGFELRILQRDRTWIARRIEGDESHAIDSLAGYLVSFVLQEMIFCAPRWVIDEGRNGLPKAMIGDLVPCWTDANNGGYVPGADLRFYWHKAGAFVRSDERGFVDIGMHDVTLADYFERFGFYSLG